MSVFDGGGVSPPRGLRRAHAPIRGVRAPRLQSSFSAPRFEPTAKLQPRVGFNDWRETSMRFFLRAVLWMAVAFGVASLRAVEATWVYAVQLSAAVDPAAGRVTLNWPADHLPAE